MKIDNQRPIAILSFNRPHYLRLVLESLAAQEPAIDPDRIFLFQDGHRSISGNDLTSPHQIEACIAEFKKFYPESRTFFEERNLGVAHNFNRAEEFFFLDMGVDDAMFFEDDLLLSPHYIRVLENLLGIAAKEAKLSYVAAYGDHHLDLQQQTDMAEELIPMQHKWGFGLTKRQWLLQRPILMPYLEIVSRRDYARRDHDAIRAYYRTLGYGSPGTSQDGMKDVASAILGTTKVMTAACFGKNIGVVGLHSDPDFYHREGFQYTQIYPKPIDTFKKPSAEQLDDWITQARSHAIENLNGR